MYTSPSTVLRGDTGAFPILPLFLLERGGGGRGREGKGREEEGERGGIRCEKDERKEGEERRKV